MDLEKESTASEREDLDEVESETSENMSTMHNITRYPPKESEK